MRSVGELSAVERMNLKNIYCCVLTKGVNPDGKPVYAYFGIFLDSLEKVLKIAREGKPFNPKDIDGIVLARSVGEPSQEVKDFMRRKFSFSEDNVVLGCIR